MAVDSAVVGSALRTSFIVGCVLALASCSPVTYGTGTGTTLQTVQDMTRMFSFDRQQPIDYQARPGLAAPPTNTLLPPGEREAAANWPQDNPQTVGPAGQERPPNLTVEQQSNCAAALSLVTPPPGYCTPNPNAPMATAGGGLFGGAEGAEVAVRTPADPCQWGQLSWAQMNSAEREAWGRLGWDASNWGSTDTALWPESVGTSWRDLRLRERRAAQTLGFSEANWNTCLV